jgi:hypothetical protein
LIERLGDLVEVTAQALFERQVADRVGGRDDAPTATPARSAIAAVDVASMPRSAATCSTASRIAVAAASRARSRITGRR